MLGWFRRTPTCGAVNLEGENVGRIWGKVNVLESKVGKRKCCDDLWESQYLGQ